MSAAGRGEHAGVEALIELTERLTRLLTDQARAFERHRPQDAAAKLPEISRLVGLYAAGAAKVRADPAITAAAPAEIRQRLVSATEAFHATLERHDHALAASKTVTEGVVRAIAEAIAAKRASNVGYGPSATRRAAATAITLNQSA
jgi:hypothetical protein